MGVTCFRAFTFIVVIAVSTGVGLFASLAELSSHPLPPLTGKYRILLFRVSVIYLTPGRKPKTTNLLKGVSRETLALGSL
jgi:hypothetical protein